MVKNDLPMHSSTPEKTNLGINNYGYDLSYVQTTGIFLIFCVNFKREQKIIDFKTHAKMFSFEKKIYIQISHFFGFFNAFFFFDFFI